MQYTLHFELPDFLAQANASELTLASEDERMAFVLDLARQNVAHGGGPFGAAVFERDSGRLVSAGTNRVVSSHLSSAHAEVMALTLAQYKLRHYNLGSRSLPAHTLVTSAEPCLMCMGAVIWSGVIQLVCAARSSDVKSIGFDEGPRPDNWIEELERRGITVTTDVQRDAARDILRDYLAAGGLVYNARCSLLR